MGQTKDPLTSMRNNQYERNRRAEYVGVRRQWLRFSRYGVYDLGCGLKECSLNESFVLSFFRSENLCVDVSNPCNCRSKNPCIDSKTGGWQHIEGDATVHAPITRCPSSRCDFNTTRRLVVYQTIAFAFDFKKAQEIDSMPSLITKA